MPTKVALLALATAPSPLPAPFTNSEGAPLALMAARVQANLLAREIDRVLVTGGPLTQAGRNQLLATGYRGGLSAPTVHLDQGPSSSAAAFQLAVELIRSGDARAMAVLECPAMGGMDGDLPRPKGFLARMGKAPDPTPANPIPLPSAPTLRALGITEDAVRAHEARMAKASGTAPAPICILLADLGWCLDQGLTPLLTVGALATGRGPNPSLAALASLKAQMKWKDFSGRTGAWPGTPAAPFLLTQARSRSKAFSKQELGLDTALGFFDETAAGSPGVPGTFLERLAARMGKIPPAGGIVVADEAPGRSGMAAFLAPHPPPKKTPAVKPSRGSLDEISVTGDNGALRDLVARAITSNVVIRHRNFAAGAAAMGQARGPLAMTLQGNVSGSSTDTRAHADACLYLAEETGSATARGAGISLAAPGDGLAKGDVIVSDGFGDPACDREPGAHPRLQRWSLPGRAALWECLGDGMDPLPLATRLGYPVARVRRPVASAMVAAVAHEACYLIQEGIPPEAIEKEMTSLGMAMSPLDLFDRFGPVRILALLQTYWGAPVMSSPFLDLALKRGWKALGEPRAAGFFIHTPAGAKLFNPETAVLVSECLGTFPAPTRPMAAQVWRLRLLAAAWREVRDAVATGILSGGDGDLLSIHALGLPQATGGLFAWWAKQDGALAAEALSLVQHRRTATGKVKAPQAPVRTPAPAPRRRAK